MTSPFDQSQPARVILDRRPGGVPSRRWLVVVRCGTGSLHKSWFQPTLPRGWDLMTQSWQEDPAGPDPHAEIVTGGGFSKLVAIHELHQGNPDLFASYSAILLMDDDLDVDHADIDLLFTLFEAHGLSLAHPAITRDSHASHGNHRQDPELGLHYTNFVEVMCPLFSLGAFLSCAETFDIARSGWGVDFVWPYLIGYPHEGIAIIDAAPVRHTKPMDLGSGALYRYLKAHGVDPEHDYHAIPALYGLKPYTPGTLSGVSLHDAFARLEEDHPGAWRLEAGRIRSNMSE